jgi:tetratricopeptide (TPR) repeat protein
VARGTNAQQPDDRSQWSFGRLLRWHLRRGTRPGANIDHPGKQWGVKEFADAVGPGDRTIRYWLNDEHLPPEIETIERVLFGGAKCYAEWRLELRHAHGMGWGTKGADKALVSGSQANKVLPASNIPIRVPTHFMGRDDALAAIEAALDHYEGRVAITALHGLRGVGKTTLAVAYADRHRSDYRVTWWIRAQTDVGMRADLVALGVRLGWVGAEEKEEPALAAVIEWLCHEGKGILLIFDNAIDADALKPYLPRGGAARVLVTSNAHAWRSVAAPVEIRLWPKEIGADYLIARTGREKERAAAEALSETLGGLPLAPEQAAAYCERLDISFADYCRRFEAAPVRFLDDTRHAPVEYYDGMTVAKTFALAIEGAGKQHPAAEPLIVHAALLAPEPIPLFLFSEAREKFGEPLASALAGDGLEEVVAELRTFALKRRDEAHRALIAALEAVYPLEGYSDPASWPRCATLTPHVVVISETEIADAETTRADLLDRAGKYCFGRATFSSARPLYERALAIHEKVLGPEHPDTATSISELAFLLHHQKDLAGARPLFERALAIREKMLGPEHPDTATSLNNLASQLRDQGDLTGARPLFERASAIRERVLGPEHPSTATSLSNLARLLNQTGYAKEAEPLFLRAIAIGEKKVGASHPLTQRYRSYYARLLLDTGHAAAALHLAQAALATLEAASGPNHPWTKESAHVTADALAALGRAEEAAALRER